MYVFKAYRYAERRHSWGLQVNWRGRIELGRTALSGELGSDRGTGTDVKPSALAKLCAPENELMCVRRWLHGQAGGRFRINKRNLVQMIWNFWDAVCFVSSNRNFLGDLRLNLLSGRAEQQRAWALLRTYLMLSRLKGRYYNFHIRYIFIFIVRL